jgi:CheY-like chemotaxis protein
MPEKDGLETIQELRQLNSHAKILAISGAFDGLFLNAARVFGADATLEKPFGPLELKQCVGRLLDAA